MELAELALPEEGTGEPCVPGRVPMLVGGKTSPPAPPLGLHPERTRAPLVNELLFIFIKGISAPSILQTRERLRFFCFPLSFRDAKSELDGVL